MTPKPPSPAMIQAALSAMPYRGEMLITIWCAMETQRLADDLAERHAATAARLRENTPWASAGAPLARIEPSPATPAHQPRQDPPWHVAGDFGR